MNYIPRQGVRLHQLAEYLIVPAEISPPLGNPPNNLHILEQRHTCLRMLGYVNRHERRKSRYPLCNRQRLALPNWCQNYCSVNMTQLQVPTVLIESGHQGAEVHILPTPNEFFSFGRDEHIEVHTWLSRPSRRQQASCCQFWGCLWLALLL